MPRSLTQYRVFIASPSGLDEERKCFAETLDKITKRHAEPRGVAFHPVGWEDTLPGAGRPQELINEDLKGCDYAVFLLHDRWGSATGTYSSGFEEEWSLAEQLYQQAKIRNIVLCFKEVAKTQLHDPGPQLSKVLEFRRRITEEKKYLFKDFKETGDFRDLLDARLAGWLTDHEKDKNSLALGEPAPDGTFGAAAGAAHDGSASNEPGFDYWIAEAESLTAADPPNYSAALFCAKKALAASGSDIEWARAKYAEGRAQFYLNSLEESLTAWATISEKFAPSDDGQKRFWCARALVGKGVTLDQLGRSDDAVATYDEVLARFGAAPELPVREQVAKALFNKGITLGQLGRSEDAVAAYDEVVARFGAARELPLRELLAETLLNKGVTLGQLGRSIDELAVYDDVITRFGSAPELPLRAQVAEAMVNKGVALGQLGRSDDAVAVCDEVVARFGSASELPLREPVAKALFNKGFTLGQLGRNDDAVAAYDEVIARFGSAPELSLREQVATVMVNKGVVLGRLGRGDDAVAAYDEVVARFGSATEPELRELVSKAQSYKQSLMKK